MALVVQKGAKTLLGFVVVLVERLPWGLQDRKPSVGMSVPQTRQL